jgi:hypothetical protein
VSKSIIAPLAEEFGSTVASWTNCSNVQPVPIQSHRSLRQESSVIKNMTTMTSTTDTNTGIKNLG